MPTCVYKDIKNLYWLVHARVRWACEHALARYVYMYAQYIYSIWTTYTYTCNNMQTKEHAHLEVCFGYVNKTYEEVYAFVYVYKVYIYRYIRVHIYIYVQMFFCMYIWCMYMCPHPHSRKLVSISVYTKVLNPNVR